MTEKDIKWAEDFNSKIDKALEWLSKLKSRDMKRFLNETFSTHSLSTLATLGTVMEAYGVDPALLLRNFLLIARAWKEDGCDPEKNFGFILGLATFTAVMITRTDDIMYR